PVYNAAGLTWKVVARKTSGIKVDLHCVNECSNWTCDMRVDAAAIHSSGKHCTCSRVVKFHNGHTGTDYTDHGPLLYFGISHLSGQTGFCKDGKAIVEFRLFITRVNVSDIKLPDFSTPDRLSNVTLVVQGKKLHLSKEYLAIHSPVFSAMFFGD
ncbi:hypothetical protein PFISCL1PPCAC_20983, partial [Pristionchus fissidentatus]